jgi:phosphate transport system permease protein
VPAAAAAAAVVTALALGWPSLAARPLDFFVGGTWDPGLDRFGALPLLAGTAITSVVALVLALPISLGAALFLADGGPRRAQPALDGAGDLAADGLAHPRGSDVAPGGFGLLTGGIVLALMVAPTTTAVGREVVRGVSRAQREAAIALGATGWEVVRIAVWPSARGGLLGAALLGLGRAVGEATAMSMVLGARADLPSGLTAPGASAAAILLDELGEAADPRHVAALGHLALALVVTSMLVHAAARLLVDRSAGGAGAEDA